MATRRYSLITGMLLLLHVPAVQADVCQPYMDCCRGYVVAIEEAGSPARTIKLVAETCEIPQNMAPGYERTVFCQQAWERISSKIARQYSSGIIGFYPPECAIDPYDPELDPEETFEPSLDPPSEAEEALEELELLEER